MSRPLIYTSSKKTGGSAVVPVVKQLQNRDLSYIQGVLPATKSPKITTVPKKVTWIQTPLTIPEKNAFLNYMFIPAPVLNDRWAFYCLCATPLLLTALAGVVLPLILWGK